LPPFDPFDWSSVMDGEGGDEEVLGVEAGFLAESAADVLGVDVDGAFAVHTPVTRGRRASLRGGCTPFFFDQGRAPHQGVMDLIVDRVLPRYPRLSLIVILIGATDVLRWLEYDAAPVLHLRDDVLDIAVTPDRGYCLSIRGVAREVATAYGVPFRDPAGVASVPAGDAPESHPVRVEDSERCPVFVTRTVTGFDPAAPSPRWLQRRVQLAGMRPISLAVDVTNYVMLELGQPIHGYDRDLLRGPIVVRRAEDGEKLTTLDGVVRTLDPDDLLITDDSGPIGLAGVMGGGTTELGPSTSSVVIEAANFEATGVSRTARRHKLPSEASRRGGRGGAPARAGARPAAGARGAGAPPRAPGGPPRPPRRRRGPTAEMLSAIPSRRLLATPATSTSRTPNADSAGYLRGRGTTA
jgi:hypothetical protein